MMSCCYVLARGAVYALCVVHNDLDVRGVEEGACVDRESGEVSCHCRCRCWVSERRGGGACGASKRIKVPPSNESFFFSLKDHPPEKKESASISPHARAYIYTFTAVLHVFIEESPQYNFATSQ